MPKSAPLTELGRKFGRPDLERDGLFIEMPYMVGVRYIFPKAKRDQGKSFLSGCAKIKDATQQAYFDKEFKRLFVGEAIPGRRKSREPPASSKFIGGRFLPAGAIKKHSSPGDYYGTFSGVIPAFGTGRRPKSKYIPQGRNFSTGPSKKGNSGYVDIGLSKYPEHKPDRYGLRPKYKQYGNILNGPMRTTHFPVPYFDNNPYQDPPNIKPGPTYIRPTEKPQTFSPLVPTGPAKWQGGAHWGCFDKFPEHKKEPYKTLYEILYKPKKEANKWLPQTHAMISFYTKSIINHNTDFRFNSRTENTYAPNFTKHIVY